MATETLKLEKKIVFKGKIKALTGLHIGGSSVGLAIGGADSVVVRNSLDNIPYIPGSSLKGKMRSLLEKIYGLVEIDTRNNEFSGKICSDLKEDVVQMFGFAANDLSQLDEDSAPTRFIVRDACLDIESVEKLENAENTDMYLTEVKTETNIDRLTSKANPRNFERVPAGSSFNFEFVLDIYDRDARYKKDGKDRETRFLELLKQGMEIIENDYLGGQGSRGYGRIQFEIEDIKIKTAEDYLNGTESAAKGLPVIEDIKKRFSTIE